MEPKPFMTISQQITLLRSRGLEFENEVRAIERIASDGYYEIINGYQEPFLDSKDHFHKGTTFEEIYSLYFTDSRIRISVIDSLIYFENTLKQHLAYLLSEKHTEIFENYVSEDVFRIGKKLKHPNPKKSLIHDRDVLFRKFGFIKNSDYEPFKNYRENHGNIPPWILFKDIDFGTLRLAITILNPEDKLLLAKRMLNQDILDAHSDQELVKLFASIIFLSHKFRNRAAHGGRIYNYSTKEKISINERLYHDSNISKTALKNDKQTNTNLFVLYNMLSYTNAGYSFMLLKSGLGVSLKAYNNSKPNKIPYMLKAMSFPDNYNINQLYEG